MRINALVSAQRLHVLPYDRAPQTYVCCKIEGKCLYEWTYTVSFSYGRHTHQDVCKCYRSADLQQASHPKHAATQVAERSLFLWNNEYIVSLVAQHRHAVLPLVFPALERNARSHWNPAVHGLTVNVRTTGLTLTLMVYLRLNPGRNLDPYPTSTLSQWRSRPRATTAAQHLC